MKFWVTLAGREAEVEFRTEGERLWLEVDGRRLEADFHRLPDGEVHSLLVNGRSYEVRVVRQESGVEPGAGGDTLEVTSLGATVPVEVRHPLEKFLQAVGSAAGAGGGETIAAPMPGLVVAIRVAMGERVAPGQAVAVVEAMKMQNELIARRGGIVGEIAVAERATVAAGQTLLKLKPEPA